MLERGRLGQEASWAAAGLIAPQAEAHEPGVFFDLAVKAKNSFDSIVDRLTRESGVDCEYDQQGVLYVAFDGPAAEELKARAKWQRELGAEVEELSAAEARKIAPAISPKVVGALHMPTNWRVDNRKLTQAYINAAVAKGVTIREGARVEAILEKRGRATGVRLDSGDSLDADVIVLAAGAWSSEVRGLEQDRIRFFPVRGQIICFDARPGLLGPSLFSGGGILVPRRDGRVIAGSVFEEAGFNKSVTMEAMEVILSAVRALAPGLGAIPFREAWAGLRPATDDLLPVIGPSPSIANVIYASGHFRSGILLSALTGEIVADLVKGRTPAIDMKPIAPERFRDGKVERVKITLKAL
jgi:glycine oxidase